jgi:uncharacterized Ntn-hydrolase superfamily protein
MLAEIEMTLSIVARCPDSGQFGVSATTALPAVGKLLTHAHPDAGAVATQARINPYLGIDGIRLLADGHDAAETIERLRGTDPCMNRRQLGLVDRTGTAAAWTGEDCIPYAGARSGDGVTVQGNRLEGPHVLDAAMDVFMGGVGRPLVARLVEALAAGVAAGGDRREERSATVYVVATEEYPLWDIRVDDHPHPISELVRLHGVFSEELLPHIERMPTRKDPAGEFGEADA